MSCTESAPGMSRGRDRRARGVTVTVAAIALALLLSPCARAQTQSEVITKGTDRLIDLQADILADNAGNGAEGSETPDDPDDGGWDFTIALGEPSHSVGASPTNIYGACALGSALGFQRGTNQPRALLGLIDAYQGFVADPTINSGPDAAFLTQLWKITGDETYRDFARDNWYSALNDIGGDPFDPRATAEAIRDSRSGQGIPGIYPWDLSLFVISAIALEKAYRNNEFRPQAVAIANVISEDLVSANPLFDISDPTQNFYDIGLAGIVIALKGTGVLPSMADSTRDLILSRQNVDGSWGFSDNFPTASYQETAYSVVALFLYRNHTPSRDARTAGSTFIATTQLPSGGWDLYMDGSTELTEANGECILAVSLVKPSSTFASEPPLLEPRPHHLPIARPFSLWETGR